ncbi:patatin-like phospholipase family protein [Microbulbifer sp. OS29]|uniref:Patatin-like phospholipase family protein n=1 Tax=Microbulbifer okhotskensis TaxID=2926617 RepID=A0A9X2ETF7_9GAMM|nr:patatin-like phospholipase family protein [Microbulbifer okhotskensis]MCO1335421.1 patatin-like phospholipase family protein [Microbulbifer okhotskensis]
MFDQVVFAGGGVRCTWQIGFWESVAKDIDLAPRVVSAVSAGALVASLILMGRSLDGVDYFVSAFKSNKKNMHWGNLLSKNPVFPHYTIYRQALTELFEGGFDQLCEVADLRVGVSTSPKWLPGPIALAVGAAIDFSDTYIYPNLHPNTALRLGYRQSFYKVRDCSDVAQLQKLVITSSCTPPLTPRLKQGGAEVLDGGVVDSVPVGGLDAGEGRVLILLTRRFPQLPDCFTVQKFNQSWTYVQPSGHVPLNVWDFANPEAVKDTFRMGTADGHAFLAFLSSEGQLMSSRL